jgi:ABC-type multidrug transport system permease subunit
MKLLTAISKNLKLLFRNKESAYTIVFGPILIILLVSFALLGSGDDFTVRVGTYSPQHTDFSDRTINALGERDYVVSVYPDQDSCVQSVKTGTTHACLVFSEREAGNGTIPVTFYVDLSRTNIIYQISDDLEGALDLQADLIREQLAGDALTRMKTASALLDRDINTTSRLAKSLGDSHLQLSTAREALGSLSNVTPNITLTGLRGYQLGLAQDTRTVVEQSDAAIEEALDIIRQLEGACVECEEQTLEHAKSTKRTLEDTQTSIVQISQDVTKQKLFEADLLLQYAIEDMERLNSSLHNDSIAREAISSGVSAASKDSERNAREIKQVVVSLRYTKDFLDGQTLGAEDISKPVTTSLVSVTASDDRLSFTYPYLLVLVIMFIGMLLASTLVVVDKTSRAAFRNFTTPTTDGYHIAVSFITASFLLALEVGLILLLSAMFVAQPLLLNPYSTIVIITLAIVFFTFLGMIIGYLSSTQEAAMIASITIGSILLFVSNVIIPVEGMARIAQAVTAFNPYLVLSELLKRSMLYGVDMAQVSREILALGITLLLLLVITVLIQRRIKSRYFRQEGGLLTPHVPAPLQLGTVQVHNEVGLLDALDRMTRAEFDSIITSDDNIISAWAAKELRNRRLSRHLRTTSKERMILRLDRHLRKHGKHIKH